MTERAGNSLSLIEGTFEATVGRYKYLPDVIALAPEIRQLFANATAGQKQDRQHLANDYLERVNSKAGSAALFVLDAEGTGVASSNWRNPRESFVGQSYSDRPYRIGAIRSGEGHFYGQGKTTLVPGYFLATAIEIDGRTAGVAVVKINLAPLERQWSDAGEPVAVADEHGVVFLTSQAPWRYRPLEPLDSKTLAEIGATKQYPGLNTKPLLAPGTPLDDGKSVQLEAGDTNRNRILLRRNLSSFGWTLIFFGDPNEVAQQAFTVAAAACFATIAALMGIFSIQQRLRMLDIERRAKNELELRVTERTLELTSANLRLQDEVEERKKAEAELFRTRDRLIEAARRAALGQFLAGLVHEVNQPLAALRTYLASTKLLVSRGKTSEVESNLGTMQTVLNHLSQLSSRLKMMARGDTKELQPTNLSESVARVLLLLRPHFEQLDIELSVEAEPRAWILGDGVRLDQILLNLLNNASDALRGRECGHVRLSLACEGGRAILVVEDNGTGVPTEITARLFEPFVTTKDPGIGLGLGLATVQRIVADHNGAILYRRSKLGGAAFIVEFPVIAAPASAEFAGAEA